MASQIKEYTLKDGTKITAYVPSNVSSDTPIFYYSYVVGSDYNKDPVWKGMEEDMARYDGDAIVIIPHDKKLQIGGESTATHKYQINATEAFETVKQDLGVETTQFINGGFSAGFGYGTRTLAHYLQENPNADRQVLLAVDGVINPTANLQQSELDALKANNTVIISFTQQKNHKYQANLFKSTNLPILYVVDNSIPEQTPDSQYWGIHDQVAMDFFDKGIYEQVINFALGKGELNLPEGYSLRYYNPKTGEIVKNITPDQAAELLGVTSFEKLSPTMQLHLATLGDISIKSSNKTLETYLNSIRARIRETNFLTANINSASFSSTTKVPTAIPELIDSYFASTASLLNSIANKTVAIAKIASEIEMVDKNLALKLESINNGESIYQAASLAEIEATQSSSIKTEEPKEEITEQIITTTENKEVEQKPQVTPTTNNNQTSGQTNVVQTTPSTTPNTTPSKTPSTTPTKPSNSTNNEQTTTPSIKEEIKIEENFPKYDELYSTSNQIVYNCNDEYKVVIHHENGKITGVEHYYDYKTTEAATTAAEQLKLEYQNVENFDQVIQKDQYVKVLFKEESYKDISLSQIKENYKDLEEVLERL